MGLHRLRPIHVEIAIAQRDRKALSAMGIKGNRRKAEIRAAIKQAEELAAIKQRQATKKASDDLETLLADEALTQRGQEVQERAHLLGLDVPLGDDPDYELAPYES